MKGEKLSKFICVFSLLLQSISVKMPPQPEVGHDVILQHLVSTNVFDKNGCLKKYNDPVWKELKETIGLTMKPTSLHLYVFKNTQKCQDKIRQLKRIDCKKRNTEKCADTSYHMFNMKNPLRKPFLQFKITFKECEWVVLQPRMINKKKKLPKGWTDIVYKKLFESQGLRCAYNFKTQNVTGTLDNCEISFVGDCRECKTSVSGESITFQDQNGDTHHGFTIKTFAVQKIFHKLKRYLAFDERRKAQVHLANQFATDYREDIQCEHMGDRSYEPENLQDSEVFEKARQEVRNKKIGYIPSMTILSISVIKKANIIKISFEPICIMYWSDEQITFWNKIRDMDVTVSLDATGGLFKSLVYKGTRSHSLLYYVMVVGVDDKIVPIMQFITAAHHVPAIHEAISMWIASGALVPRSISTDASATLQHALTMEFNKTTFSEHNLINYQYLKNEDVKLPPCFYKSDTPHLLRTLNRWSCFKAMNPDVLLFYKRLIAYMTRIQDINAFEKAALSLITVSLSETIPPGSECEKCLNELEHIIRTHSFIDQCLEEPRQSAATHEPPKSLKKKNSLTLFIQSIVDKAKSQSSRYNKTQKHPPNAYCVPGFLQNFQPLCEKFTTWTDVMVDKYKLKGRNINSARSETYFRKKKVQIPNPVNIVKFLLHDNMKIKAYVTRDYPSVRFRDRQITPNAEKKSLLELALEKIF